MRGVNHSLKIAYKVEILKDFWKTFGIERFEIFLVLMGFSIKIFEIYF